MTPNKLSVYSYSTSRVRRTASESAVREAAAAIVGAALLGSLVFAAVVLLYAVSWSGLRLPFAGGPV